MSSSSIFVLLAIVIYLVGMILIGYRHSKGTSTSSDFYLGGRKLGPVVAAMSTEASDMSAYLLMGVPGLALFCGVAEAGWTAIGLAAGTYLNWLIVPPAPHLFCEAGRHHRSGLSFKALPGQHQAH